jgi:hypothetical protein
LPARGCGPLPYAVLRLLRLILVVFAYLSLLEIISSFKKKPFSFLGERLFVLLEYILLPAFLFDKQNDDDHDWKKICSSHFVVPLFIKKAILII